MTGDSTFELTYFDEPEIHLHPYLQGSLVKYINKILNNEENDFTELVTAR